MSTEVKQMRTPSHSLVTCYSFQKLPAHTTVSFRIELMQHVRAGHRLIPCNRNFTV